MVGNQSFSPTFKWLSELSHYSQQEFKSVSYQDKQKQWKSYTEVVIFDFDIPKETKDEPKQTKKSYRK